MKLLLERNELSDSATLGSLFVDGQWECYTLEDVMRDEKVKHETAIPYGIYKVFITFSNRFKEDMPILADVPEYEGIRIHPGNTDKHTSGCILVGRVKGKNRISESRQAYVELFAKIKKARDRKEDVTIEIVPGENLLKG